MQRFEPSDAPGLAPLLKLHQAAITSAEIRKDGRLTLAFTDGAMLEVLPDERYEAFKVTGSRPPIRRGFSFLAIPGGGLARFETRPGTRLYDSTHSRDASTFAGARHGNL